MLYGVDSALFQLLTVFVKSRIFTKVEAEWVDEVPRWLV